MVAAGLFYLLRQLERWLHQHIFKVGWLLTKNFHTTTILYYTFFLPGVILHEVVYWLAAGVVNVRADRAIAFPEKQEVAELRLNFIKLSKKASPLRVAIISTVPLVVGIAAVLYIALNIVSIGDFLTILGSGNFDAIALALQQLTSAPDFWLWVYLMFTIGNTMMPNFKDLQGYRVVGIIVAVIIIGLIVLGAWERIIVGVLSSAVADALNTLSGIFAIIIGVDLFMVVLLGTIEAIIERITGNSATFKDGKLIAMTRAEMLAQRDQQIKRERQLATKKAPALPSGPPSIYKSPLPIPSAPGKEPVTQLPAAVLGSQTTAAPKLPQRAAPSVITPSPALSASTPSAAPSPSSPGARPSVSPSAPPPRSPGSPSPTSPGARSPMSPSTPSPLSPGSPAGSRSTSETSAPSSSGGLLRSPGALPLTRAAGTLPPRPEPDDDEDEDDEDEIEDEEYEDETDDEESSL